VKAIGLIGSPRSNGNTAALVEEVLRGAKEAGASVESVLLNDLDIGSCQACNACHSTGRCVLRDDMDALWERLWSADVWVFGTPIYWVGPSAQMKAFLDRWYAPASHPETLAHFAGRRAGLVAAMHNTNANRADNTQSIFQFTLDYVGIDLVGTVLATRVDAPGEVRDHAPVMAAARQLGVDLVG